VAQLKRVDFTSCGALRPGRLKTVTTLEIIDQIQELILEDRRISDNIMNFVEWLAKLRQRRKKCIELGGEYVE
jgi:hypothetical protein